MKEPIKTNCNEGCFADFRVTKIRSRKVKGGIDKHFFRCPHCNHEYVAYYSNAETLKLQKEMKRLQKEMPKLANRNKDATEEQWVKIVDDYWLKINAHKVMIKKSMDEARQIAEA